MSGGVPWAVLPGVVAVAAVALLLIRHVGLRRERKRLEALEGELRASVSTYRSLIDSVTELIYVHEIDTGRFVDVNEAVLATFGYPREEILGATPALIADPSRVDLGQDRERVRAAAAGTPQRFEWWGRTEPGRVVPMEIVLVRGTYFGQDVIIAVARDITQRIASEEAMRVKEEQYRDLFEADLAGNFVGRPDGTLEACNEAFCRIAGFASVAEALDLGFAPLASRTRPLRALLDRLRETGRIQAEEFDFRRRDGAALRVLLYARGVFEDGVLVRFHGHCLDITQQKAMAERVRDAQKMEAVGALAGGIAHDFNNALTTIQGHAELLLEELRVDAPGRADLMEIRRSAERAGRLTQKLLSFSRRRVLRPRAVDLAALVRDGTGLLERVLGEDIHLAVDAEGDVGRIRADPGEVEQVLTNLVINAREALPAGGIVQVRVRACVVPGCPDAEAHVEAGRYALLQVQDDGVGMEAGIRERAFEPFFTTKTEPGGSGLGLATVYGVVQDAGGAVWVDSEPGRGATFSACFPCTEEPRSADVEAGGPPPPATRVLLAEDEAGVRRLARRVLEQEGLVVTEAEDGRAALDRARADRDPFDLLVTDVVMPRMPGTELADRLRARNPTLRVLFMSGYTEADQLRDGALGAGQSFLAKPFTPGALRQAIRDLLRTGTAPEGS